MSEVLGGACGFGGHGRGFVTGFGIVSETYVGTDCGSAYHTRGSRTVVVERCNAFVSGNEWKLCIRQAAVLPTEASSHGSEVRPPRYGEVPNKALSLSLSLE